MMTRCPGRTLSLPAEAAALSSRVPAGRLGRNSTVVDAPSAPESPARRGRRLRTDGSFRSRPRPGSGEGNRPERLQRSRGGGLTQSVAACSHSRLYASCSSEAGSFVRFKVFEHQAHVLRVEDVGPSAIAQRVELAAQALGRWAAAPGVP